MTTEILSRKSFLTCFNEKLQNIKKYHFPLWLKITAIVLATLLGFVLFLTAAGGALALMRAHLSILAPLNSAITSLWKELGYLMTSMGIPALIIFLTLIIYGVYTAVKAIQKHNNRLVDDTPLSRTTKQNHTTVKVTDDMLKKYDMNLMETWEKVTKQNDVLVFINSSVFNNYGFIVPQGNFVAIYYELNPISDQLSRIFAYGSTLEELKKNCHKIERGGKIIT